MTSQNQPEQTQFPRTKWEWKRSALSVVNFSSSFWAHRFDRWSKSLRKRNPKGLLRLLLNTMMGVDRRLVQFCQRKSIAVEWRALDGTAFCHPAFDPYWERSDLPNAKYEPELFELIWRIKDVPFVFLDCGANFGYWSAIASSPTMGNHKAVAVEASPISFKTLVRTANRNGGRFDVIHRALASRTGDTVEFEHMIAHAGSHISNVTSKTHKNSLCVRVDTINLDSLIQEFCTADQPIIIKLDVEGQEIGALNGGLTLRDRDVMLIYEDHGNDCESLVSAALLDRNWSIYWPELSETGLKLVKVVNAEDLKIYKTNPHCGYNLIGISEPRNTVWRSLIESD